MIFTFLVTLVDFINLTSWDHRNAKKKKKRESDFFLKLTLVETLRGTFTLSRQMRDDDSASCFSFT